MLKSTKQINEQIENELPPSLFISTLFFNGKTHRQHVEDYILSVRVGDLIEIKKNIETLRDLVLAQYYNESAKVAYDSVIELIDSQISLLKSKKSMKGIVALHGLRKGRIWSDRVQKKTRKKPIRLCFLCQKDISNKNGNAIYCGNDRKKTGCSYKAKVLSAKRWKKKVKYWKWPERIIKSRIYGRKYDTYKRKRK